MKVESALTPIAQAKITALLGQVVRPEIAAEANLAHWLSDIFNTTTRGTSRDYEVPASMTKSGRPELIQLRDNDYIYSEVED